VKRTVAAPGRGGTTVAVTPPVIKALRAFTRSDPIVNDRESLEALEKELFNTSDRVTAVMFAAHIEAALEKLLASRLHYRRDCTFSKKIDMAHANKIIGPITRSDLYFIKELRNESAHSRRPFDFQAPQIAAVCKELKVPHLQDSSDSFKSGIGTGSKSESWLLFVSACHNLAYRMLVKREGPKEGDFVFLNDEPLP
jgi:hypothetical protein